MKKVDHVPLSGAGPTGKRFDISLRQGAKPPPPSAERAATAQNNLFDGRIAGEEGLREHFQKACILHAGRGGRTLQRVSPCVSFSALERSGAHATDCQFFTLPWGNPREAEPSP